MLVAAVVLLSAGLTVLGLQDRGEHAPAEPGAQAKKPDGMASSPFALMEKSRRLAKVDKQAAQDGQLLPTEIVLLPKQENVKQARDNPPPPEPKKDMDAAAKKPPEIVDNGTDRKLNLPDGSYTIALFNRAKVKLKGTVKTLKVDLVENESELDTSGLDVQEIIIGRILNRGRVKLKGTAKTLKVDHVETGELDASALEVQQVNIGTIVSNSKVKLNAPGGKVEVRGTVNSQSVVTIFAPRGTVIFLERIDTDVRLNITAKEVELRGTIVGNTTYALVTLTAGGRLQFREVAGTARLEYRKANAADPELAIQAGVVGTRAKFSKVQ